VIRVLAAAAILAIAAGCGKPPEPKADAAKERAEALERSKQGAFGTQVQSIEKAKGMEADMNQKAQDNLDKADAMSK
jgi:spore germination cell wall hydrolase CwlJ-like protein